MNCSKIAVIGGSFDPVHLGHIAMARTVLEHLDVDKVLFVPTKQNPLKTQTTTSYTERCEMVSLVLEEKMELYTSDYEYTIDLINELQTQYQKIYFVIGDDQVKQLNLWKSIDELLSKVQFVCLERNDICTQSRYPLIRLPFKNHFESSTAIRNGDFKYLDKKVLHYILDKQLYLKEILKQHVDTYRYHHSISVMETARKIAISHQFNDDEIKNIEIAALLHDICKCWEKEKLQVYMEKYFPDKLKYSYKVWHGYVASIYLKDKLCIDNVCILNAIKNHTILEDYNRFNLVIKLADIIEPLRQNVDNEVIELAFINLEQAYKLWEKRYKND